jgi:hypothetical protein
LFLIQPQVQVFDAEVACYQCLLTAVHSSIKLVTSAIKGFEPVTGEFQELVRQLSSNEVGQSNLGGSCVGVVWAITLAEFVHNPC